VVNFVEAIACDATIEPNFADGVKCIQVLEAGLKSAAEGRKVVL